MTSFKLDKPDAVPPGLFLKSYGREDDYDEYIKRMQCYFKTRRIFHIDVGDIPVEEATSYIKKVRDSLNKKMTFKDGI